MDKQVVARAEWMALYDRAIENGFGLESPSSWRSIGVQTKDPVFNLMIYLMVTRQNDLEKRLESLESCKGEGVDHLNETPSSISSTAINPVPSTLDKNASEPFVPSQSLLDSDYQNSQYWFDDSEGLTEVDNLENSAQLTDGFARRLESHLNAEKKIASANVDKLESSKTVAVGFCKPLDSLVGTVKKTAAQSKTKPETLVCTDVDNLESSKPATVALCKPSKSLVNTEKKNSSQAKIKPEASVGANVDNLKISDKLTIGPSKTLESHLNAEKKTAEQALLKRDAWVDGDAEHDKNSRELCRLKRIKERKELAKSFRLDHSKIRANPSNNNARITRKPAENKKASLSTADKVKAARLGKLRRNLKPSPVLNQFKRPRMRSPSPVKKPENTQELVQSFDKIPEKRPHPFQYKEPTVRKKAERAKMTGHTCVDCKEYYEMQRNGKNDKEIDSAINKSSRHRAVNPLPDVSLTPVEFWQTTVPDTQQLYEDRDIKVADYDFEPMDLPLMDIRNEDDESQEY